MIPAMTELLGPDQHLYQSAAMIVNFFVVVPAVYQHSRAGAIERAAVIRIVPPALLAVVAGVGLSELPAFRGDQEVYLRGVFALFLLLVGVYELARLYLRPSAQTETTKQVTSSSHGCPPISWTRGAAVALPTGLLAGLLGVGGGLLAVPLQRWFLRIPLRSAIANSATVIIATSLIGATAKNYAYLTAHAWSMKPFVLAAVLAPSAMIGSLYGSKLTHRLPLRTVKAAFCALLIAAALRLTVAAVSSFPSETRAAPYVDHAASARRPSLAGLHRRGYVKPAQLPRLVPPIRVGRWLFRDVVILAHARGWAWGEHGCNARRLCECRGGC